MIRIYLDENVEGQIARGLRARGIDLITAEEDDHAHTPDPVVFDRANELGRVIFSRDQDFLREAHGRQESGATFVGVIYAHKRLVTIGRCIEDLEFMMLAGIPRDFADQVRYLPLAARA